MKILHLSDLHIGKEWNRTSESGETDRIARSICRTWGDDDDKPIVLNSGDVVDDGSEGEFQTAQRALARLKRAGFQVVAVPGNHDYGRNGCHALERKFKLFKKYLFGAQCRVHYPHVPVCSDEATLICLNSMKAETGPLEGLLADGELGDNQLNDLAELIEDIRQERSRTHRIVLALHHHPFLFPDDSLCRRVFEQLGHRLKDGADLMRIIAGRVDVLLFGHEHRHCDFASEFQEAALTQEYAIPTILCNGKSTAPGHPARLITVSKGRKPTVKEARL